MFSRQVIDENLRAWAAQKGNFDPVPRSVIEVERATAHFDSLIIPYEGEKIPNVHVFQIQGEDFISSRDATRDWRATLTPDEIRWIRNERIMARADFLYFCSRYAFIKDKASRVIRMQPWRSQEIFLDIVSELEVGKHAIMLDILKGRQLGLSRIISLIILSYIVFRGHINAFMASCTEDKTGLLFDMLDFCLERLPFWMRPEEKFRRENKFLEFNNGSSLTLQHGQQSTGIARGTTPQIAHITELAEFDEVKVADLIDSSLLEAMHNSPGVFLALEGTAKGINNWWHKTWESCKAGWPEHRSRLRPLFLPWFVGGLHPDQDWLFDHPMPIDYSSIMKPWAAAHAKMAKEYVDKTDYLRSRLGSTWQMPIEQIWHYEFRRDEAIRKNALNKFLQEHPANDDEAFQSTNISVFDVETITYYRDNAHTQPLLGAYGLVGPPEIVNPRLQPPMLARDDRKPSININACPSTGFPIHFELVPLKFDGWSLESGLDKIYIWELPVEGETYGFGMDTADGIGKDRTAIEGIRKNSVWGPTKQCVEYASDKCSALDTWPFLLALGSLYSVGDGRSAGVRQPRMAIECKGQGDLPQNIIRMMGWSNFHPWNDKQLDARQPKLSQYNKIGVYTASGWFRDGMISMLVKMLRDGDIEIASPFFVKEMASLEGDEVVQSLRAGYGGHDDRIMSLGFILVSLYKWDAEYYRSSKIAAYSGKSPVGRPDRPKQYARWAYGYQERTDSGIYIPESERQY